MKIGGFTIIELLIAMAIFAIIAAISIPVYTNYSQRGFRTELMGDLMNCAQALERFNAINFTYVGANPGGDDTPLDNTVCAPDSVRAGRYVVNAVTTVDTFVLTATPAGSMLNTGILTLDQAGNRTWNEDNGAMDAEDFDWEED